VRRPTYGNACKEKAAVYDEVAVELGIDLHDNADH
jgi:hypothetical protein